MQSLRETAGMRLQGHAAKPFPLHFEEIRNSFLQRQRGATEARFLRVVAQQMKSLRPGTLHRRLARLQVDNILTTHYDDGLERALASSAAVDDFGTRELRHSLFRRSRIGGVHVWHLHGDIFRPTSVLLGHDRYVESSARIRRYCDPTLGLPFKAHSLPLQAVFRRDDARIQSRRPHSWVDLFMLRDVHIVGFGLDYTEVDLWYLLSLRQRLRHSPAPRYRGLRRTRIVFHHFASDDDSSAQKSELLQSFDVECVAHPLRNNDYTAAWNRLLLKLESQLGSRGA
jgi:hypothetical protein